MIIQETELIQLYFVQWLYIYFIAIILYEALKTLSCFRFMAMSAYHRFAWLFGDDFHLRNENKPFRGHRSDGGKERDDL